MEFVIAGIVFLVFAVIGGVTYCVGHQQGWSEGFQAGFKDGREM